VHQSRLARIPAGHRNAIGPRWRRLTPDAHALLVLTHLRNGDTYQPLTDRFDIGIATVYRYVQEALALLAALAPSPAAVRWRLCWSGDQYTIPEQYAGARRAVTSDHDSPSQMAPLCGRP